MAANSFFNMADQTDQNSPQAIGQQQQQQAVRHDPYGLPAMGPGGDGSNMPRLMSPPEIDINSIAGYPTSPVGTGPASPGDPAHMPRPDFANAVPPNLRMASGQGLTSPPMPALGGTPGPVSLNSPTAQLPMSPNVGPPVLLSPTTPPQSPGAVSIGGPSPLISFLPTGLQPRVNAGPPQQQQPQGQGQGVIFGGQQQPPQQGGAPTSPAQMALPYSVMPLSPTSGAAPMPLGAQQQSRQQRRGNRPTSASPESLPRSPIHSGSLSPSPDASPKNRRHRNFSSKGGRKLFIGQLPKTITSAELSTLMQQYGEIEDLHLIVDRNTGKGTGAAFLVYCHPESALAAVRDLHNKVKLPKMETLMQVRLAEGELPADRDVKLFVGQVPTCCDESHLSQLFGKYPELLEVAVLRKDGKSRGCAFVRFGQKMSAEAALKDLDGKATLPGSQLPISVKYANTEAEKRKKREDKVKPMGMASPQSASGGGAVQRAQQLQQGGRQVDVSSPTLGMQDNSGLGVISPTNALQAQTHYNPQMLAQQQVNAAMNPSQVAQLGQMNSQLGQMGLAGGFPVTAGAFPAAAAFNGYQLQPGMAPQQMTGLQQPNIYLAGGQPKILLGAAGLQNQVMFGQSQGDDGQSQLLQQHQQLLPGTQQ